MPDPMVELLINGSTWVDITNVDRDTKVLGRDRISIHRGRADWGSRVAHSTCNLSVLNKDGNLSPRNPLGLWYGQIGRNTILRVTKGGQIRYLGEISELPQRLEPDVYVPLEASGVLRRLSQGGTPLKSVMYRALLQLGQVQEPVAYWTCEDGSDAHYLQSAVDTGRPMKLFGDINTGSYNGFASSEALPVMNAGYAYGDVPSYSVVAGSTTGCFLVHIPDAGLAANGSSLAVFNTVGSATYWRIQANIDRTIRLQVADSGGSALLTTGSSSFTIGTGGALIKLVLTQSGGNIQWLVHCYNVGDSTVNALSGTLASQQYGRINRVTLASLKNLGDTAIGHVAVFQGVVLAAKLQDPSNAYTGEAAGRRIERLCVEEGIPLGVVGSLDDSQPMGPQRPKNALDLMFEAADADGGILHEPIVVSRTLGDFEDGTTQGWVGGGASPPTMVNSVVRAHTGTHSLEVTWPGGSSDQIAHTPQPDSFVPGMSYTFSAWCFVQSTANHVALAVGGVGFGPSTTVKNAWQQLSYTFTATDTSNEAQVWAVVPSTAGGKVWLDDLTVTVNRPGLAYRNRRSLYRQAASLALTYSAGHIMPPFEPTDDDQATVNDVSVTREGASTARCEVTSGPLSTRIPPNGVGRYATSGTYNVVDDFAAADLAQWLAFLGTWDEQRYPKLAINLRRFTTLITQAAATDIGDLIHVTGLPSSLPPKAIDAIVQGYDETIDVNQWDISYNCTPAGPFQNVGKEGVARPDSLSSNIFSTITTTQTAVDVQFAAGKARWINTARFPSQFPFGVGFGGETAQCTAIDDTISFVSAGTAAHASNATVVPGLPSGHALGDLLVVLSATRSSGLGVPTAPTGYVPLLPVIGNVGLFGKVRGASESAPTCGFSGGGANMSFSAQMICLRGRFGDPTQVLVGGSSTLNASAQDIAYPAAHIGMHGCLILHIGWKQDDWTSVATLSGATEIGDLPTALGDDQGLVWDYRIQTTASDLPSGSFTVTGGASAVSRGIVLALHCDLQRFTLSRSTNGIVKGHAAGTQIRLADPSYIPW